MMPLRIMLIRVSLLVNVILIVYLFIFWHSVCPVHRIRDWHPKDHRNSVPFIDETTDKKHPLGQIFYVAHGDPVKKDSLNNDAGPTIHQVVPLAEPSKSESTDKLQDQKPSLTDPEDHEGEYQEPPREVQERAGITEVPMVAAALPEENPDPPLDSQEKKMYSNLRDCLTKPLQQRYFQRGDHWVLENYIPAVMNFRCDESITYTTHSDYTFLDNLDPLTSRWQGPVSVAVYAPGDDFKNTIDTILYLRNCMAEGVKKYVTFHIFFHMDHVPKDIPTTDQLLLRKTACDKDPPKWTNITTYRQQKNLLYPVNVGRNIARENTATFFSFPSDVELYPSTNFIPEFFKMLKKPDASTTKSPRVYVFPIFEIAENTSPPETKPDLQALLKTKKAIPFHKYVCPKCHAQPKSKEWQNAKVEPGLSVFYVGKRQHPYNKWEPIYIGTDREPIYDERLSWEGKSDKMSQMYALCVKDYEFHILDNAFLVHRPGIKKYVKNKTRDKIVGQQSSKLSKKILPEYKILFGTKKGCIM